MLRDISILHCGYALQAEPIRLLDLMRKQVTEYEFGIFVDGRNALAQTPTDDVLYRYLRIRDQIFPSSKHLFVTSNGSDYQHAKFQQRRLALFLGARLCPIPDVIQITHLKQLFSYYTHRHRHYLQMLVAVGLTLLLGLRPSEVAKLVRSDVDISACNIYLRDTKSQCDQQVPLVEMLVGYMVQYLRNLKPSSPLFINNRGLAWDRRDVHLAVKTWGKMHGISELTPRKLRATVGSYLIQKGVDIKTVAMLLRHADPATTLRHYTQVNFEQSRTILNGVFQSVNTPVDQGCLQEQNGRLKESIHV